MYNFQAYLVYQKGLYLRRYKQSSLLLWQQRQRATRNCFMMNLTKSVGLVKIYAEPANVTVFFGLSLGTVMCTHR